MHDIVNVSHISWVSFYALSFVLCECVREHLSLCCCSTSLFPPDTRRATFSAVCAQVCVDHVSDSMNWTTRTRYLDFYGADTQPTNSTSRSLAPVAKRKLNNNKKKPTTKLSGVSSFICWKCWTLQRATFFIVAFQVPNVFNLTLSSVELRRNWFAHHLESSVEILGPFLIIPSSLIGKWILIFYYIRRRLHQQLVRMSSWRVKGFWTIRESSHAFS